MGVDLKDYLSGSKKSSFSSRLFIRGLGLEEIILELDQIIYRSRSPQREYQMIRTKGRANTILLNTPNWPIPAPHFAAYAYCVGNVLDWSLVNGPIQPPPSNIKYDLHRFHQWAESYVHYTIDRPPASSSGDIGDFIRGIIKSIKKASKVWDVILMGDGINTSSQETIKSSDNLDYEKSIVDFFTSHSNAPVATIIGEGSEERKSQILRDSEYRFAAHVLSHD